MSTQSVAPQMTMLRMLTGFHVTQMLAVAARLGVADLLAAGLQSAEELAGATGAHPDALYRLLRALANMGIFEALPERRFALTPLGATLRADPPDGMRAFAMFLGDEVYRAWGDLHYTITTGRPAFDHIFGAHNFDYLGAHPASNEIFNQAMSATARREIVAMVAVYDFAGAERVVDVGGGHGLLLSEILQANPTLRGVLFDLPHVVVSAGPMLGAAGVADRYEVAGGDFFTEVPPKGDILTLSHILHDWDDEHCVQILRNCTRALQPAGRLLIIEDVIESGANAPQTLFKDMQMMTLNGGRERTAAEYERLFTAAGLRLNRIIPTQVTTRILEGVAISED